MKRAYSLYETRLRGAMVVALIILSGLEVYFDKYDHHDSLQACLMERMAIDNHSPFEKDTWYNPDEFPRSFVKGSGEGFWWAFVTMTTVG